MTASFTHCLRNARFDLIALLVGVFLFWACAGLARSEVAAAEVTSWQVERDADALLLSASVKFELSAAVEEALNKGVPIVFVAEVDIFRERWYWTNKKVASAQRHMRLSYHPLTRRWRLNIASGPITQSGAALALNQNFDSLAEALMVVQRLSRWKIADIAEIDTDQRHQVEFRFRMDLSQLPRPFQIGTLGQTDWNISVSSSQPLLPDAIK